jgi:hypothetical protein
LAIADIKNMNPNTEPNPEKTPPVRRRPIFAILAILMGGLQCAYQAWAILSGAEQLVDKAVQDANIGFFFLGAVVWIIVFFGLLALGLLFLVIALIRRERPAAWLWVAALAVLSTPGVLWLLSAASSTSG